MERFVKCVYCAGDIPASEERCPQCARPGLFPNVRAAEDEEEQEALSDRHSTAVEETRTRGAGRVCEDFETAVASSHAVINRSVSEVLRLAASRNELYATFYQLVSAGVKIPYGNKWDRLRPIVDHALFPYYAKHIRFGALSLNRLGPSYGDCTLCLRTDMIAHRASVFEQNSVMWFAQRHIQLSDLENMPRGYRATWLDRGKLAVAKLGHKIEAGTPADSYPDLLLQRGGSPEDDDFVEVHIWGPMTIPTFERVTLPRTLTRKSQRSILRGLQKKLSKEGVEFETL